jgi:hypothetical protein
MVRRRELSQLLDSKMDVVILMAFLRCGDYNSHFNIHTSRVVAPWLSLG